MIIFLKHRSISQWIRAFYLNSYGFNCECICVMKTQSAFSESMLVIDICNKMKHGKRHNWIKCIEELPSMPATDWEFFAWTGKKTWIFNEEKKCAHTSKMGTARNQLQSKSDMIDFNEQTIHIYNMIVNQKLISQELKKIFHWNEQSNLSCAAAAHNVENITRFLDLLFLL